MSGTVQSPVADHARVVGQYRAVLRRWFWLLGLCMLLGGVSAFAGSKLIHPSYRATTLLVVGQPTTGSDPYTGLLASELLVTTYLNLISQPVVLQRAAAQVGGITAQRLASQVSVKNQAGTPIIELDVDDTSAVRAARLANAIAAAFIGMQQDSSSAALARAVQHVNQQLAQVSAQITTLTAQSDALSATDPNSPHLQVLQQQLAAAAARRDALQTVTSQLTSQAVTATSNVSVFQPATPPAAPNHPRPLLNAVIGAALGLVIAAALIWLLEFFDDHIRTPEQAEELLGLPPLATIGVHPRRALLLGGAPSRKLAMSIRGLVAKVDLAHLGDPPRTIAVASASSGEGRTTVAANLAIALARRGKRVLLMDGDLRKPRQADLPGGKRVWLPRSSYSRLDVRELLDRPADLSTTLSLSQVAYRQLQEALPFPTVRGVPSLFVLPAGPKLPDPSELFRSDRMRHMLEWLVDDPAGGRFDAIVLDSAPADIYPDAALLARWVDATVLVVDATRSSKATVLRAKDALLRAHASITGVVLNRASAPGHDIGMADDLDIASADEPSTPRDKGTVRVEQNGLVDSSAVPLPERQNGHTISRSAHRTVPAVPLEQRTDRDASTLRDDG